MPFYDKKVLFIGAHTDDEMVCAGTLHRLVQQGCKVSMLVMATAATKEDRYGGRAAEIKVRPEFHQSVSIIGALQPIFIDISPSIDFQPHRQKICQEIFDWCEELKPDVVFTLSPEDENTAHSIVGIESERVMRGRVATLIRCQFPWNYSIGRPNFFVKLADKDVEAKRAVINCYQSQLWRYKYEEMLLSYARADGLSVKCEYAERFELIRSVQ